MHELSWIGWHFGSIESPSATGREMGTFTQSIELHSSLNDHSEVVQALVDTGATFSAVPARVLERLGVVPHRSITLRLANGQIERRDIGRVRAALNGIFEEIICVFGDADGPALIGAHTLEAFLLAVDPVGKRLVPVEGYWA